MSPEMLGTWGPIVVMIAIFYFLLYRPQKKQQNRRRAMLDSLKKGDQVITIGGIYGTIVELGDTSPLSTTLYRSAGSASRSAEALRWVWDEGGTMRWAFGLEPNSFLQSVRFSDALQIALSACRKNSFL